MVSLRLSALSPCIAIFGKNDLLGLPWVSNLLLPRHVARFRQQPTISQLSNNVIHTPCIEFSNTFWSLRLTGASKADGDLRVEGKLNSAPLGLKC